MTTDEIVELALGRASEISATYAGPRGPMYRRLGTRQRYLFARAGKLNPERYGMCVTSDLQTVDDVRVIDLSDIDPATTPEPSAIQAVTVHDPGSSTYAVGRIVSIVRVDRPNDELAPRAFLRDKLLIGVGTDLDLVTTLKFHYPRLSDLLTDSDADTDLELVAPHDVLLEIDLTRWIVTKATEVSVEVREKMLTSLEAEEKVCLAEFDADVASFAPVVSRFTRPQTGV